MEVSEPQKSINDVVSSVKSEGLFDQFRKECLEEFDNMDNYRQLKQQVENHVASFLSKHKYDISLQKNMLRNELRNHITKSEVILNSVKHLVDEVLSAKGHSFCLIIDKQVDKYLNKDKQSQTTADTTFKEETEVTEIEEVQMELNDKVEIEVDVNNVTNNEKQINRCTEENSTNEQINGTSEEGKHRPEKRMDTNIHCSTSLPTNKLTLDNRKDDASDIYKANNQLESNSFVENAKISVATSSNENKTFDKMSIDMGSKNVKEKEKNLRRRSSRTRIVPLKYRDEGESDSGNEGRKKHRRSRKMLDDTESISSNDVDDNQDRSIVITIKSKKHDNDTDSISSNDADMDSKPNKLIIKIDDSLQKNTESLNKNLKLNDGTVALGSNKDSSKFFDENSKIKRGRPRKRNSTSEYRKRKHSSVTNENESDDESIVSKRGRRSFRRQCYSPS
ncbi:biorientation of chromosomes in cell division protein 1-like 1 isoform X2 [Hydra vulgaris]